MGSNPIGVTSFLARYVITMTNALKYDDRQKSVPNRLTLAARNALKVPTKLLFTVLLNKLGASGFYHTSAQIRCKELVSQLRSEFGNEVLAGTFKGMTVPDATSWYDGCMAAKIIGTYESNLQAVLQKAIERAPDVVVNVGCAEGYYAVGLARLLPQATVYAYDIDARAGAVCASAAQENGVADRVIVKGLFTPENLSDVTKNARKALIVMDCEGSELELLDLVKAPGLARCDIIVETHDFNIPGITATLERRFENTHDVHRISQGGRNPNEVESLSRFSEVDRWLMVSENRGDIMTWLACWAR